MSKTSVEWARNSDGSAGHTWNSMVGCSRKSSGCDHCYAEGQAHRFQGRYDRKGTIKLGATAREGLTFLPTVDGKSLGKGARWTGAVWLLPDVLDVPLRRKKPTTYFVNSLSDVFHESVVGCEDGRRFIAAMFGVMAACPQHTFQILTKRPDKMREWFAWLTGTLDVLPVGDELMGIAREAVPERSDQIVMSTMKARNPWPLPNVWLGVSVEDQKRADERVPELLRVPAAVRFLSCEPLLGPVDLSEWIAPADYCSSCGAERDKIGEDRCDDCGAVGFMTTHWGRDQIDWVRDGTRYNDGHDRIDGPQLSWVIAGGESGHGARPMHPDWARSLRDQCVEAGVPFFLKQWGAWGWGDAHGDQLPDETVRMIDAGNEPERLDRLRPIRLGKKKAGRLLDGRTWDQFPEVGECGL